MAPINRPIESNNIECIQIETEILDALFSMRSVKNSLGNR